MTQHSNLPAFQSSSSLHFIGIGGTGMNGVAQLAAHAGYSVSGSDRATDLEIFRTLEELGVTLFPQDGSGITKETDFVVYSTAIEQGNPDLEKAKELGVTPLHRAEMLARLCEGKEVIAVAGTAGKSTVTGLLGWIFQCLEKDPTVYCGARINNFSSSIRFGKSDLWIIEADESDKSFLRFHPNHAIITNISEDHFELSELRKLFAQFESQVSGIVIKPNPPRRSGTPPKRGFISSSDSPLMEGWPKAGVGSLLIGKHNTENIHNALSLCQALGFDMQKCVEALASFKGIERRLERVGNMVIDDFAHSPVKIAAALEAVSGEFEAFNAVWRPHGFTPLFQGLEGFVEVFSNHWKEAACPPKPWRRREPPPIKFSKHWKTHSGKLFILPVYYAGGTVEKKITSEQFVERLQAAGVPAEFVEDLYPTKNKKGGGSLLRQGFGGQAASLEQQLLESGLPVLVMGARDPELPKFARRLASKLDLESGKS